MFYTHFAYSSVDYNNITLLAHLRSTAIGQSKAYWNIFSIKFYTLNFNWQVGVVGKNQKTKKVEKFSKSIAII